MALPRFVQPIPVRFLTDYARSLQMSSLNGPLKGAANDLIHNVMFREQIDSDVSTAIERANKFEHGVKDDDDASDDSDPLLGTLEKVIEGIMTGQSLAPQQDKIKQYIHNQQERADLITNLLLTKDYQRLVKHIRVRDMLEDRLLSAAQRGDLNTSELMALSQMINEQSSKLENRVQAGASSASDVMTLLNKADYHLHLHENNMKAKFKNTSATGREIVRRVLHKLHKVNKATEDSK